MIIADFRGNKISVRRTAEECDNLDEMAQWPIYIDGCHGEFITLTIAQAEDVIRFVGLLAAENRTVDSTWTTCTGPTLDFQGVILESGRVYLAEYEEQIPLGTVEQAAEFGTHLQAALHSLRPSDWVMLNHWTEGA